MNTLSLLNPEESTFFRCTRQKADYKISRGSPQCAGRQFRAENRMKRAGTANIISACTDKIRDELIYD